ncbi:MAG: hypothetical protein ABR505_12045 [Actinomycetota bacterium]
MPEESNRGHLEELGLPDGTAILRNPSEDELRDAAGFPEDSELLERHGRRFHLIEGRDRTILEMVHFVERRHGVLRKPQIEEDTTIYLLPKGTSLLEARRIGYDLLERSIEPPGHEQQSGD